jgi:hypothetical protein
MPGVNLNMTDQIAKIKKNTFLKKNFFKVAGNPELQLTLALTTHSRP